MNGTKQDSKAAVFPNQRAHRSDKNRNHTCLKHTRSAASHAGEHIPERRLSRTEHDNGTGSNTDKEYDKTPEMPAMPPISTSRYGTVCSRWYSWTIGVPGACRKEITRISASAARAAGRAIQKFSRNLSFISQPCPLQAAIVVSEMKERLSPNMDPPMTEATQSASEKAGGLGNSRGDRHEKRDRSDGGSHGRGDEAGNDKEHSDGILCRNPGEHEIGNALCTAPSDNADKRACGEEDQQHCDDVLPRCPVP